MQITRLELPLGSVSLILETGKLAKQAHGAVVVSLGETLVLVTAVEGGVDPKRDFFPLTVDYREKTYAAGKFPGGYIKRETRPTTKETLTSRLIDRPIRPLFPLNYLNEVQVMCSTLSADRDYDPDVLALIGASAALHISHIPFVEPTGGVRVGRVGGQLVVMPTYAQLEESDLDLVVSGTKSAITMIEGFAREMPEEEMLKAILFAHEHIRRIVEAIEQFRTQAGLPVKVLPAAPVTPALHAEVLEKFGQDFVQAKYTPGKAARAAAISAVKDKIKAIYLAADRQPPVESSVLSGILSQIEEKVVREAILSGKRLDGRQEDEIRALHCETDLLPRVHGSALFQRGETQALVSVTLGTSSDEQRMEGLVEEFSKKFSVSFAHGWSFPVPIPGSRTRRLNRLSARDEGPARHPIHCCGDRSDGAWQPRNERHRRAPLGHLENRSRASRCSATAVQQGPRLWKSTSGLELRQPQLVAGGARSHHGGARIPAAADEIPGDWRTRNHKHSERAR